MKKEENMRVYVVDSRYEGNVTNPVVTDVPPVPFLNSRNPLYIGVRQGQINRMQRNIKKEKLGGTAVGYWEMMPYVSKKGKVNLEEFGKHDVIFLASPERCDEKYRATYTEFVKLITASL